MAFADALPARYTKHPIKNAFKRQKAVDNCNMKKISMKYFIYFQLVFLLFSGLLVDLGLPHAILYLMDAVNIVLLVGLLLSRKKKRLRPARNVLVAMGIWLGYMVVSTLFKGPSLLRILFAIRNWCRGWVLLCACLVYFDREDIRRLLKLFFILYAVNFLLILGQFFFLNRKDDSLGGLFGSAVGCNGQCCIFNSIVLLCALCSDLDRDRLTLQTAFIMLSSMAIAGLEEIKFYFYAFPLLMGAALLLNGWGKRISWKTVGKVLLCTAAGLAIGMWIFYLVYPRSFRIMIGKTSVAAYEETSRISYKISRFHFISEINDLFFHGSVPLNLTGLGFGNCEYSKASSLVSDFYRQYGDMNYLFFATQPMYLEGGLVGMLLFMAIPAVTGTEQGLAMLRKRKTPPAQIFGVLFSLFILGSFVYNNSLRGDFSYMFYFAMTLPWFFAGEEQQRG